jgi:hypothetical protein
LRGVGVARVFTDMAQLPALLAGWEPPVAGPDRDSV